MKKNLLGLVPIFAVIAVAVYGSNKGYINAERTFDAAIDTIPSSTKYVDVNTGETLDLFYNKREGKAYNLKDRQPIQFYVNANTGDTIYGRGRLIVNNFIIKSADGKWGWDTTKVKVDTDGEVKFKDRNRKVKVDNSEIKIKEGNLKLKSDSTDVKLKGPAGKIKAGENKPTKVKLDK